MDPETQIVFDDEGQAAVPLRFDATITLDALDILRLWEVLQVANRSDAIYSDTADWVGARLAAMADLPFVTSELEVGEPSF